MSTKNLFIKDQAYGGYYIPLSLWQTRQRFFTIPDTANYDLLRRLIPFN